MNTPKTRWEEATTEGYGRKFTAAAAAGEDIYQEARLAHALVTPGADILDAGCGMGRTAAHLQHLGHNAIGVDVDPTLLALASTTYPALRTHHARIDHLTAEELTTHHLPAEFDLITCVGNVMIVLAPDTEVTALQRMRALLKPGGRILIGFNTNAIVPNSRTYSYDEFAQDCAHAKLHIEHRYNTYTMQEAKPHDTFIVAVLKDHVRLDLGANLLA